MWMSWMTTTTCYTNVTLALGEYVYQLSSSDQELNTAIRNSKINPAKFYYQKAMHG